MGGFAGGFKGERGEEPALVEELDADEASDCSLGGMGGDFGRPSIFKLAFLVSFRNRESFGCLVDGDCSALSVLECSHTICSPRAPISSASRDLRRLLESSESLFRSVSSNTLWRTECVGVLSFLTVERMRFIVLRKSSLETAEGVCVCVCRCAL